MALCARRVAIAAAISYLLIPSCRPQQAPQAESNVEPFSAGDSLIPVERVTLPETLRYAVQPTEWYDYWMIRLDTLIQDTMRHTSAVRQFYRKVIHAIRPDGRIEVGLRIDTLIASFTLPDTNGTARSFAYDSRSAGDRTNPEFAHLSALLGTEVRMLVTPDGRIDSVFGLDAVLRRLRQLSTDTIPEALEPLMERQLEEQMYLPLQQEYVAFPTAPLDTTRTWRHEYSDVLAAMFPVQNTAEYRIVGARPMGGRQLLEIHAVLRSRPQQRRLQQGPLQVELRQASLSGRGRILADAQQGYTVAKEVRLQSRFEVLLRDTLQQRTENIRQTANSYVEFRLVQRGWLRK
ncbi:MAG: DUF6263 family protein [Candidatus Kapabacteria bacterium]|nr:DUF6263 family protein [Candidatus Kapabacteria bacterium]MDW8011696.1 DUF6263 family protein [Bacteroidota bacterium]